jgi:hypothetical protein
LRERPEREKEKITDVDLAALGGVILGSLDLKFIADGWIGL